MNEPQWVDVPLDGLDLEPRRCPYCAELLPADVTVETCPVLLRRPDDDLEPAPVVDVGPSLFDYLDVARRDVAEWLDR